MPAGRTYKDRQFDKVKVTDEQRREEMLDFYADGWTLSQIGGEFGVTKQRVHQILVSHPEYQKFRDLRRVRD